MFANKLTVQRSVTKFYYDILANPLPKLCLRRPIILSVAANDQGVFLFFPPFLFSAFLFLLFFFAVHNIHADIRRSIKFCARRRT